MAKKYNKYTVITAVGLLLLLAAIILTVYNIWDECRANASAENVLGQMSVPELSVADTYTSEEVIPDYILNPNMDMPAMTIDGNEYIGIVEIPSIGLSLPVMAQWSYPKLKLSPCRYSGSAYTDSLIIAGHNYRSHFGSLKNLSEGDSVLFTDTDGNKFSYVVREVETLWPTDIEGMKSGDWDLTLFTCTLGGRTRVTVRCEKI